MWAGCGVGGAGCPAAPPTAFPGSPTFPGSTAFPGSAASGPAGAHRATAAGVAAGQLVPFLLKKGKVDIFSLFAAEQE